MGKGKVFLIGAGPGDPELLTLKAARDAGLGTPALILIDLVVGLACQIEQTGFRRRTA